MTAESDARIKRTESPFWLAGVIVVVSGTALLMMATHTVLEDFGLFGLVIGLIGLAIVELEVRYGK